MAEAAKDQDQSMEDILQSIKRIIAEEGEPTSDASGSDVLELTELLAEDGSVSKAQGAGQPPTAAPSVSIDEIMAAPVSSTPAAAAEAKEEVVEPAPEAAAPAEAEAPAEEPPAEVAAEEVAEEAPASDEGLLSGETLSASMTALNALRDSLNAPAPQAPRSSVGFRSGTTVEDLVREALKPMLKEWLDHNLPAIVETLVQKEISKLSQ